jgi:hypothetical protein
MDMSSAGNYRRSACGIGVRRGTLRYRCLSNARCVAGALSFDDRPVIPRRALIAGSLALLSACGSDTPTGTTTGTGFTINPCGASGTLTLAIATSSRMDCSTGGTTVTLAGNGASYLVVPQLATDQGANTAVSYTLSSSASTATASRSPSDAGISASRIPGGGTLPNFRNLTAERAAEGLLRARATQRDYGASVRTRMLPAMSAALSAVVPPPAIGSIRSFRVVSNFTPTAYKTVGGKLAYAGDNILIYIDTLAPANGFTPTQLNDFGKLFDQTLYPIDTTAFGSPVDLDANGRVVMLMSPVVNGDSPAAQCATQGYVAGFINTEDFNGPSDPNSNQGEIFYTIVPDPGATASCAHTVQDLGANVPATFLHELQHLIFFSQHVIIGGAAPGSSALDEGLSIVAEELGSKYYEDKCPPPSCRTSPAQLFPDSSQGFLGSFLYDSYQYALHPDTASITLHEDDQNGFDWRGGNWLLARWLGDQFGTSVFKKLLKSTSNGAAVIDQATGQTFGSIFANFGIALYTDSLPGLPRTTAPPANRFSSRNVKALWARLFTTSGGAPDIPLAAPIQPRSITTDSSTRKMTPGSMSFYRLDTPASAASVTIRFAAPGGTALAATLKPQLAIFRLPVGQ